MPILKGVAAAVVVHFLGGSLPWYWEIVVWANLLTVGATNTGLFPGGSPGEGVSRSRFDRYRYSVSHGGDGMEE